MDFFEKLKKEKLLLSVMMMAMVDLIILAVLIVFPLMDFNYKSRETSKSTTENLSSNPGSDFEQNQNLEEGDFNEIGFDGPISDKFNKYGVEGYNANKGNGGEAAKDTSVVSTEDDDSLVDDNYITTKDTVSTEEPNSSENPASDSEQQSTNDSSSEVSSSEPDTVDASSEEISTEEISSEAPQTSTEL